MQRKTVSKTIGGAMVAALMVTTSAERVQADGKDAIIGFALGAIAAGAASKNKQRSTRSTKQRTYKKASKPRPSMSAAQRQQNMDVQSALNAFNFNAGGVDGQLGKRSRAAIRDYQGYMGYAQTGQLTDWERQALVNSWRKYTAGVGGAYPRTMAAVGARGLLNMERDPNYPAQFGDNVPQAGTNQFATANQGGNWNGNRTGTQAFQPQQPQQQPLQQQPPMQPQAGQVLAGTALPKLKSLKPLGQAAVSAAGRCELVVQTTRIQGGVIQAANMTDPNQALSEKFCEARGFAITQGTTVASGFQVSETELTSLCEQIATGYASVIAGLPSMPQAQVMTSAQSASAALGLTDPGTTATYGQICMGIGYRLDKADMALSGALAMMSAGRAPYGEMVGHHLREGFGVPATPSAAVPYYQTAIQALEQGAEPAFVASTTAERVQVIRAALQMEEQRASATGALPQLIKTSNQLPALKPINQ